MAIKAIKIIGTPAIQWLGSSSVEEPIQWEGLWPNNCSAASIVALVCVNTAFFCSFGLVRYRATRALVKV